MAGGEPTQMEAIKHILEAGDDPSDILRVDQNASQEEISKAFEMLRYPLVDGGLPLDEIHGGCRAHARKNSGYEKSLLY